ncbi:MAG: hypothetical protein ABSE46_19385 [Terracidiphilus sp.]
MATTSALGSATALPQIGAAPRNYDVRHDHGSISLTRDGVEFFRVNTCDFSGRPSIWLEREMQSVLFGLRNARFPGTSLSADFDCEFWTAYDGSRIRFNFPQLGAVFMGSASSWGRGFPLYGRLKQTNSISSHHECSVQIASGPLVFHNDWTFSSGNRNALTASLDGHPFGAASFSIRLASGSENSLIINPPKRRTLLSIHRGNNAWSLRPKTHTAWEYGESASYFDELEIEYGETSAGSRTCTYLAKRGATRQPIPVALHDSMVASDGRPLNLHVQDLRYSVHFGSVREAALMGELATVPSVRIGNVGLVLKNPHDGPAFEVIERDSETTPTLSSSYTVEGLLGEDIICLDGGKKISWWKLWFSLPSSKKPKGNRLATVHPERGADGRLIVKGNVHFSILRPSDFLSLDFEFRNVKLYGRGVHPAILSADDESQPSFMIAHFPPQVLAEAYLVAGSSAPSDPPIGACPTPLPSALQAKLPGRTRLVFTLFKNSREMALTAENLLNWSSLGVKVNGRATVQPGGAVPIDETDTILEMPARLLLSPPSNAQFSADAKTRAVAGSKAFELWSASLVPGKVTGTGSLRPIATRPGSSLPLPLADLDARTLVTELAQSWVPTQSLFLSSAGGWMESHVLIDDPDVALASWDEDIVQGRVNKDVETYRCRLIPSGHPALLVKQTRREWCIGGGASLEAPLIQRYKIRILKPDVVFPTDFGAASDSCHPGFNFPWSQITFRISETPYLEPTGAETFCDAAEQDLQLAAPYWPSINSNGAIVPFEFPIQGLDWAGQTIKIAIPMVLALDIPAAPADLLIKQFNDSSTFSNRTRSFGDQKIAYATPNKKGDTSFPTQELTWHAFQPQSGKNLWYPTLQQVALNLEATQQFGSGNVPKFEYADLYLQHGLCTSAGSCGNGAPGGGTNPGEAIMQIAGVRSYVALKAAAIRAGTPAPTAPSTPPLTFPGSMAGGLAKPSAQIGGLTRKVGTLFCSAENIASAAAGQFSALDAFVNDIGDISNLLGVLDLSDIVAPVTNALNQLESIPSIISQELFALQSGYDTAMADLQALQAIDATLANAAIAQVQSQLASTTALFSAQVEAVLREQLPSPALINSSPLLQQIRTIANSSTVERLIDTGCFNGQETYVTLPQVRDCLISVCVANGLSAAQYAAFAGICDADLTTLAPVQLNAAGIVKQLSALPILQLAASASSFVNAASKGDPIGLGEAVAALIPVLSALTSDQPPINQTLSSALAPYNNAINDLLDSANGGVATYVGAFNATIDALYASATSTQKQAINAAVQAAKLAASTIQTNINTTIASSLQTVAQISQALQPLVTFAAQVAGQYSTIVKAVTDLQALLSELQIPRSVSISYDTASRLQDWPEDDPLFVASNNGKNAQLNVRSSATVYLDGTPTNLNVQTGITNFSLMLLPVLPFLQVNVDSFTFQAQTGVKPTVHFGLSPGGVQFIGVLDFVQNLQSLVSSLGLGDGVGAYLTQTADGVAAGLQVPVPDISCGAFDLTNLSFNSGIALDFSGGPMTAQVGFADANQHFLLAYGIFGGGGYLTLTADLRGIQEIAAALEFGAVAELDIVVASGSAHILGGFYFDLQLSDTGTGLTLTGYVRAGGELDVLDILSMSVEFILSLSYENRGGSAWMVGECIYTVEIDILFFHKEVDLTLRREFSGQSAG